MGMKKIKKAIEAYANEQYDVGYDAGLDQAYPEGYDDGFAVGVKAERSRIINLFRMLSDNELEHGTGTKAKMWKDAADTVKIADELEVFDEEGNLVDNEF